MPDQPRVLVVEDDQSVREAVALALQDDGYQTYALPHGLEVEAVARSFQPDLAVLDVRLPEGPGGLSMARLIRSISDIPVIFLTAADSVEDRLAGFKAGGDDYLVKPFSMAELLARVEALLRRSGRIRSGTRTVADVTIDEDGRTVRRGGIELELTRTEFDLLLALARSPGRVFSKTQLLTDVWGFDAYDPNVVEVHVSSLRRKLEAHGDRLIHTMRGVGYVLRA
ncbi:MAG: response regulator transcription factor [Actinobacteria bacterium]|nr:response regulator transcription factor [Actinomycetota bacterium]